MKIFLFICLASGLASSEKLDRSYLPPPGSKFSGGSPGDIQVPFEFPKETYTTVRPQDGKPDIGFGINQRPPSLGVSESQKPGFTQFRNSYTVPKTTTSYAITQTTTFAPAGDYEGQDQPTGFNNVSTGIQTTIPGLSNQQQPLRGPAQLPSFNQYRQGPNEPSTIAPYGTTARPLFPGTQKGLEYLPPSPFSNNSGQSPGQGISSQDSFGYQSGQPQGLEYPNGSLPFPGQTNINLPSLAPGSNQRTQYTGSQNIPSSVAPQYKDGGFRPLGPGFQQTQDQLPGSQLPSSTAVPQYQYGQRFTTPEINQQDQFSINQNIPFSTALPTPEFNQQRVPSTSAPQYQNGQHFTTPGHLQGFVSGQLNQNQYVGNQNLASSTAVPQFQNGERVSSPGYVQQGIASSVTPVQNQYQGYQNFPFSTAAPQYQNGLQFTTPGSTRENQYVGNQKLQSTPAPTYQDRQRYSTPSQVISEQQSFGSHMPNQQSQNQYVGNENFPSSTLPPLNQAGQRFSMPISQIPNQQSENQYAENQNNYPSSTAAPQYQDGQGYTTSRFQTPNQQNQNQYSDNQNYPSSTTAPQYQDSQRFITPGSQIPNQQIQNQHSRDQNFPKSTVAPQYQEGQRFTISGSQIPNRQSQNLYSENQNYPSSTIAPQYPGGQHFATPGSQIPNQQSLPSSTAVPHFQDQRFSTSGQQSLSNQQTYPGSTIAPQYQQTFAPTPGISQPEFIPGQQNQYQQPTYNQQVPSSTGAPQFLTESQAYGKEGTQSTPETAVSFPAAQGGLSRTQISMYGNTQQPASPTGAGSPIYSTTPSGVSGILNQGFPSTTIGLQPARDFSTMTGFGNIVQRRPDRPQAENERNAEILNYENVLTPEGYSYSYDTSNGIHADETGTVGNGTRAQGGFSYTGDDGKVYSVFYSADENGFQPQGDHLPTSPPIPEAIQRVIDQAIKDKESGIEDDGSYDEEKYGYIKYEGPLTRPPIPQKKTMSTVNGVDLPDVNKTRVEGQKNKVLQPNGSHSNADRYSEADASAKFEPEPETEIGETETNENERVGEYHPNDNVGRISTKRPKPIKNLTVEDNRRNRFRGHKMPIKTNMSSKFDLMQNKKSFDTNSQANRPASPEKDEDIVRDDVSIFDVTDEGKEDVGSATAGAQEYDYESDLVNYKDDPNNRTNFHGINRYLPNAKGINRKNQSDKGRPPVQEGDSHKDAGVNKSGEPENASDIDETRTRIPTRKNNIGQKVKGQTRVTEQPSFVSDDKTNNYDDSSIVTEDNDFDEDAGPPSDKPGALQSKNKTFEKPKRPNFNNRRVIGENINIKPSPNGETGYEYTPPQRTFETGGKLGFPSKRPVSGKPTFTPKGSQTTLRPFMTKNVYGDETETAEDEDVDQPNAVKPDHRERPTTAQMQQYSGLKQDGESFARPQTSTTPQYESEGVTDQIRYNEPINTQGSQKAGDKVFYNTNTPNRGTSGNIFSSTTPLPPSGPNSIIQYQRPGQYQGRPTDASESYDDTSSPGKTYTKIPGANESVSNQVPSTTFRPNYSFGDRTLAPSGPFSVDGFGRPIPSTNGPVFDKTLRPTYSTARPSTAESPMGDKFKSTLGRFGVTSAPTQGTPGYQSSTSAPIGEDFSGPKQPQGFDSQSGYYYK